MRIPFEQLSNLNNQKRWRYLTFRGFANLVITHREEDAILMQEQSRFGIANQVRNIPNNNLTFQWLRPWFAPIMGAKCTTGTVSASGVTILLMG
jgi:hypothetical protein